MTRRIIRTAKIQAEIISELEKESLITKSEEPKSPQLTTDRYADLATLPKAVRFKRDKRESPTVQSEI